MRARLRRRRWRASSTTAQQAAAQQYQQLLREGREAHARAEASGVGNWRSLVAGGGGAAVVSILKYFKPVGGGKQHAAAARDPGCILSYLRAPDGSALPAPPKPAAAAAGRGGKAPAQKQWAHKEVAAGGGGKRKWGPRGGQPQPMRQWQLVPGTPFVVDRFNNLPQQVGCSVDRGVHRCNAVCTRCGSALRAVPGGMRPLALLCRPPADPLQTLVPHTFPC